MSSRNAPPRSADGACGSGDDGTFFECGGDLPAAQRNDAEELRAQNERFTAAVENMSHGLCMFDADERMIVCNGHYMRMFGLAPAVMQPGVTLFQILQHSVDVGIAAVSVEELYAERKQFIERREASSYPEALADGRIITISHRPMENGGWVSIYEDITERRRGENAIEEQNRRFDAALSNMSQGLLMFDAETRLIVRNQRYLELYGLDPEQQPLGATHREIVEVLVGQGIYPEADVDQIVEPTKAAVVSGRTLTVYRELADGRTIHVTHRPMAGGGWVATFEDVTESRRVEASIRHMAHHDALTDLANRMTFGKRVEQALAQCKLDRRPLAIFSIDLDRFKAVNDTLGHPVGDKILKSVSKRLRAIIREGTDTAARVGGDEFSVLLVGMDKSGAEQMAARLIDSINQPYAADGHHISIGASIGISLAPEDGLDLERLVKNADLALYRAKQEKHGGYRFFEAQMDTNRRLRHALEIDLREALSRHELELFYQPVMAISSGGIGGFEALLRWRCPMRGLVLPSDFVPVAEETNLIGPIGEWVLFQACAEATSWPAGLLVSVNVSAVQFRRGNFAETVRSALKATGLEANRLELEITETVLMDQSDAVLQTLRQLRAMNVRIALDDFGTGYSSLSYLRKFPFDRIKIDRSFTAGIDHADTAAIVSAIVGLGKQLGMAVTAEGVETADQLALVRAAGCTDAQGYLIGEPGPARRIKAILARKRMRSVA